jgi:hypothetical protein
VTADGVDDPPGLSDDLAGFLLAFEGIDAPGCSQLFPGRSLPVYDAETGAATAVLRDGIEGRRASRAWEAVVERFGSAQRSACTVT